MQLFSVETTIFSKSKKKNCRRRHKNIGRNPIVDCELNGEKNRKRMEKQKRLEKTRIEKKRIEKNKIEKREECIK